MVTNAGGVKLGIPEGPRRSVKAGVALRVPATTNAAAFAQDLLPVLVDIQASGHVSLRAIAAALQARGMMTRRGGGGTCPMWEIYLRS